MFRNFKHHLFRSPYQSMAAILVISLSLFLISVFFLIGMGFRGILQYFESRPQIIIYLKDEATSQAVDLLKAKIEGSGKAKEVEYVSKEKALSIYRELFKDKPLLLEMVTAKILPASLEVSPNNLDCVHDIVEMVKGESIVEDLEYEEDVITNLQKLTTVLKKVGIGIAGFLLFVSVLIVLVVLGMRIFQRKEEIEILKLLGAARCYIYFPLYLEGIFYGVMGALISWGFSYLALYYSTPFLKNFLLGIPLLPVSFLFMLKLLAGLIILGSFVGLLGSLLAVLRSSRSIR